MYVAIELKEKVDGSLEVSTFKKDTREEVESAYHSILTSAAKSSYPIHSAVILNPEGQRLRGECYKHPQKTGVNEPEEKGGEK